MKKLIFWQVANFVFISLFGTLLHFLFEWFDSSIWLAPFSGVNESTWEHMKLLFWPAFLFAIFQSFFLKNREDFWKVKLKGILLGIFLIPTIFYTYNGVVGKSPDFVNIFIFYLCALVLSIYEFFKLSKDDCGAKHSTLSLIFLCLVALCFFAFTFFPPQINLFKDPLTNSFGLLL